MSSTPATTRAGRGRYTLSSAFVMLATIACSAPSGDASGEDPLVDPGTDGVIFGQVLGFDRAPDPRARVWVSGDPGVGSRQCIVRTDSEGRYRVRVPAGRYKVSVPGREGMMFIDIQEERAPIPVTKVTVVSGEEVHVDPPHPLWGCDSAIYGQVLDYDHVPDSRAMVSAIEDTDTDLRPRSFLARTDGEGRFRMPIPPGRYIIVVPQRNGMLFLSNGRGATTMVDVPAGEAVEVDPPHPRWR